MARRVLMIFVAGVIAVASVLFVQSNDSDEIIQRSIERGRELCQRIQEVNDSLFLELDVFQMLMRQNKERHKELERLKDLILESRKLANQSKRLLDEAAVAKNEQEYNEKMEQFIKIFTQADEKFGEALKGAKALGVSLEQECQPKIKI